MHAKGFCRNRSSLKSLYPQLPRHLRAPAACAFFTRGRKSEWLQHDWDEVDFEALVICFVKTKNKHPREVPIIPGLMLDSLRAAFDIRNAAWPEQPAVFAYDGHRMSTVGRAWDKACEQSGHPGCSFMICGVPLTRVCATMASVRESGSKSTGTGRHHGHRTASMDLRYGIVDSDDITSAREELAARLPKSKKAK